MVVGCYWSQLWTDSDETRAGLIDGTPELVEVVIDGAGGCSALTELIGMGCESLFDATLKCLDLSIDERELG